MPVTLSDEAFRRISAVVRWAEKYQKREADLPELEVEKGPQEVTTKVTDDTPTADGYYESVFQILDEAATWLDLDECLIYGLNEETLTVDTRYKGYVVGYMEPDDPDYPSWAIVEVVVGGGGGCTPDVEAITDVTPSFSGCTLTITGTKKQFNCDGTTTNLTDTTHTATLPTTSKTFLTDVSISGSCSGTTITLTVTKTTDTVKVPSGC